MNLSDLKILSSKEYLAHQPHVRGLRRATGTKRWHLVPMFRARRFACRATDARIRIYS